MGGSEQLVQSVSLRREEVSKYLTSASIQYFFV